MNPYSEKTIPLRNPGCHSARRNTETSPTDEAECVGYIDDAYRILTCPWYYAIAAIVSITFIQITQLVYYIESGTFQEVYSPDYLKDIAQGAVTILVIWRFCYNVEFSFNFEYLLATVQTLFCLLLVFVIRERDLFIRCITIAQVLCPLLSFILTVGKAKFDQHYFVCLNNSMLPILLSHSMFYLNYSFDGYFYKNTFLNRLPLIYFVSVVAMKLIYLNEYLAAELTSDGIRLDEYDALFDSSIQSPASDPRLSICDPFAYDIYPSLEIPMNHIHTQKPLLRQLDKNTLPILFFGYVMLLDFVMIILKIGCS
ncbi:hypothetical protein BABINDRAFT_161180 [Babjeviella inositovora NRRL Y-12698]|uniref:Uncharacterized protein n=1 Tax=Babjeviella inositovora NRRL Y-12698 TaxID=984486 RepID=A0A1E3QRD6_9ASCO|nr:uncharacterized protein BABINDRAFT_161180 [Babjeviella inositovora NRRL Y-12698]ODQ80210.1 hypothetical protein BABINDRAFT_161180 [Babjeviella inositovora NRRL Y-12698]